MDDATNNLMWLRGQGGEQGLNSMNFQPLGMFPWMQTRVDSMLPLPLGNQNQQYQAMLSSGFQNLRGGDMLNSQMMQFQQPLQFLEQSASQIPMLQQQQQLIHPSIAHQILQGQAQDSKDNLPQRVLPQEYFKHNEGLGLATQQLCGSEPFSLPNNEMHNRQQLTMTPSLGKADTRTANAELASSTQEIGNLSDISQVNQTMLNEQNSQHPLVSLNSFTPINAFADAASLPPYPRKDTSIETGNCSLDVQNHNVFGANLDSSGLVLPMTMPTSYRTSSNDAELCSIPSGTSGFHNSMYGCNSNSPELHSEGQVDLLNPTRTFVKVYKSGSVGRSLDISRFSSYHELREELGRMFGIEGKLDNPLRSGWQLVFVDRENDVLLLGDDPWEAFVYNVSYIKILSPEDVQKLGKLGTETYS